MKGDALYWSLAYALNWLVWGGELLDRENLPKEFPVVFVSNHAAALGPIAVMASLPVRVYPWVVSDMLDWNKAAEYLRRDFVEPQLHIPRFMSMKISKLISLASVRLLGAIESIPVWHGEKLLETYRISLHALVEGRSILVFPEDPAQKMNELFRMTPFKKSFARLGAIYYERTKKILHFHPLAVHPLARKVRIGKPISYSSYNDPVAESIRIKNALETMVHDLYLSIILDGYSGIPLPH